jgi:hypothetical protein
MLRTARNRVALLFVILKTPFHSLFLPGDGRQLVDDNMDGPNAYACGCSCSAETAINMRVSASLDDAEGPQTTDPEGVTDLDLGGAIVGVRFNSLAIPPGAVITHAAIQFTARRTFSVDNTTSLDLDVFAEAADNAPPFAANVVNNLGTLPRTSASTGWKVPPWNVADSGTAQITTDLGAILREVIGRTGWRSGNAITIIFAGSGGRRQAESFDGDRFRAPVLTVQFQVSADQSLSVCVPPDLNPNLTDASGTHHQLPTRDQLQADCTGRVEKTFGDLALACGYPAQCACDLIEAPQPFNATCNNNCDAVPLDPTCANFNPPLGEVGATNVTGDTPVCVVPRDAANRPSAITAAMFGQQSDCHVEGPAQIDVADEKKSTRAQGVIGLIGKPCPETGCSVGLTYGLSLNPVTFDSFFSSATFRDLTSTGASAPDAGFIDPAGLGIVGAQQTDSSVRGRRDDDTRAFVLTNPSELGLLVGWDAHTCGLFGDVAGTVTDNDDQSFTASVTVQGSIANEPPLADAGQDQTVECTSHDGARVVLDGRGSSDPEDNAILFSWFQGSRVGPSVGSGEIAEVQQAAGAPTDYLLRVIDAFGQSDEAVTTVGVVDTTAPELSLSVSPAMLFPPNHKLVAVTVNPVVDDACDASPTLRLVSIASNEGDLADGSGHSSPDIQDAQFGIDDRLLLLRAERRGSGSARIYTITYEAVDANGNVTSSQATVVAPKN